ncbi:hypothetical protein MAR_029256 [Mya arenaria]|uniref:Uncharacterized protein n=1 Tax=Mya arenaria TaxID=6604 RepID=A0ABY7DHV9_MYAAR|nr:hypothetical protein MAR_029256 [Mya arenaria]
MREKIDLPQMPLPHQWSPHHLPHPWACRIAGGRAGGLRQNDARSSHMGSIDLPQKPLPHQWSPHHLPHPWACRIAGGRAGGLRQNDARSSHMGSVGPSHSPRQVLTKMECLHLKWEEHWGSRGSGFNTDQDGVSTDEGGALAQQGDYFGPPPLEGSIYAPCQYEVKNQGFVMFKRGSFPHGGNVQPDLTQWTMIFIL